MADESKTSKRDETLISVLGRLGDQIAQHEASLADMAKRVAGLSVHLGSQESLLEDIEKQQLSIFDRLSGQESLLADLSKRQLSLSESVERMAAFSNTRGGETEENLKKINATLQRYRSDMYRFADSQDLFGERIKEMEKREDAIAYAQEGFKQLLGDFEKRFDALEKNSREHYSFSVRSEETTVREAAGLSQSFTRLQMDAEKHLAEEHAETQRQIADMSRGFSKLHMDTEKRLAEEHAETHRQLN
jgi:hypothetical protein